jgi:predicted permease
MVTVDLEVLFNWGFLGAYVGAQGITFVLAMLLGEWLFRNSFSEAAMNGMNAVYSNTGYMGIPLALAAFGSASTVPTIITVVVNSAVVVALTTVFIEVAQNRGGGVVGIVRDVVRALVTNPMLMAPMLGIVWSATDFGLATPVNNFCTILGAAAGPCALFAIGLFLVGKPISEGLGEVSANLGMKLVVQPLITWWLAVAVFDLDPLWVVIGVLMAALPTGAGSFVLAQTYQVYVQRTSSAILLSTVLSVLTLSVFFVLFPPTSG